MKLRICHYPQIPCEPFIVEVNSIKEAKLIEYTLSSQHLFLYENGIIPDYSNALIIQMWAEEDKEWYDFEYDE